MSAGQGERRERVRMKTPGDVGWEGRYGQGGGELEGKPASSQRRREGLGDEVDEAKG